MSTTTPRLLQDCDPMLPTKILLLTRIILKTFQEKKKRFLIMLLVMLCSILSCFSWHILLQGQEFWVPQLIPHVLGQKVKFTIHLSLFTITIHLLLFMTLFTPKFCLFKGGCPLYFKQVLVCLVQDFFPRESYPLRAFLWEISLLITTSLHLYYLYKACN